ncbi:MAG: hypothetical protein GY782_03595 [Gammaproteobacteria bacterium]|nr:hypothetical protein [Gammaproteobacteria bacterium]
MTAINRLTNKATLADNDLIPIWDGDAGRTRSVNADSIAKYVKGEIDDGIYVKSGSLEGGVLTLTYNNGQSFSVEGFESGSVDLIEHFETQITGSGEFITHNLDRYLGPDQFVIDETTGETQVISCENIDASGNPSKNTCKILSTTQMNGLLILK